MADRTQSDLSPTVDDDSKRFLKKAEVEDATVPDVEVGSPPTPCSGSPNISYSLASLPSTLMFTWMKPLLELGKTKPLDVEDLYELLPQDTAEHVEQAFSQHWSQQLQGTARLRHRQGPSLTFAFAGAFGGPFLASGGLKLVHDLCIFVGPFLLKRIILFLDDPSLPLWLGLSYVLGLLLSNLVMSACLRQYFFHCYRTGLRLRSAAITSVYQKALRLSSGSLSRQSTGEITNLMSVDASRLQDLTPYLHAVWYSPLQILLALFFLWRELGVSCLAGMLVILGTIPLTGFIAKRMQALQGTLMKAKDERQKLNNEVLSGIKGIKMQAWERSFQERLQALRDAELAVLWRYLLVKAVSGTIWSSTPLAVSLVTFGVYVMLGNTLEVSRALTALALFEILRFPLFMLPNVVNNLVEAGVTVSRLKSFLVSEEREPVSSGTLTAPGVALEQVTCAWDNPSLRKSVLSPAEAEGSAPDVTSKGKGKKGAVGKTYSALEDKEWQVALLQAQLREAEKEVLRWEHKYNCSTDPTSPTSPTSPLSPTSPPPAGTPVKDAKDGLLALSRTSLKAHAPQLVGIVGQVGSGKSTMLAAILGEVKVLAGQAAVEGSLAYVGQHPFIRNASLRDNVLFGLPWDEGRYRATVKACALRPDFRALPHGDHTIIGEKGITLSGGQKARVGLARAVYSDADVYLLDDPLSAVDAHVGKVLLQVLFEQCVRGMLRTKCVIMVTNALQYLNVFDAIYVLKDGRVAASGSFADLSARPTGPFHALMQANAETLKSLQDMAQPAPLDDAEELALKAPGPAPGDEPRASVGNGSFAAAGDAAATAQEERGTGSVARAVYASWARAAGGFGVVALILAIFALAEVNNALTKWWISYWSDHRDAHSPLWFLGWFVALNAATSVFYLLQELVLSAKGLRAGRTLYQGLLAAVLRAPMAFFDTTPLGRVMNRFSKDVYTVDETLADTINMYAACIMQVCSVLVVICLVTPWFIVALVPIVAFYAHSQRYYITTSRELKRLDSISRSPLHELFAETLHGLTTIRAFRAEERFVNRNKALLDRNQRAYFLSFSGNCWLAMRLELAGTLIVTCAALFAVLEHGRHANFASIAGLSISFALSVTQALNWSVRMAAQLETDMVSVERLQHYIADVAPEAPAEVPAADPPADWPTAGALEFRDVKLRYRPGLPLVLKGLTLSIAAGQKVGVVGRTGAGKSSLVAALLRLVEAESGQILLDGVDIAAIGLQPLRGRMAVIPQDPLLFSGTVRSNLDPFAQYSDAELWAALERVRLAPSLGGLADAVEDAGRNFSVGQRQLLCIARALLRRCRVIVMDEATAAVDVETDAALQEAMRTEFAAATTLTVAHRLNTILDSDRVVVMDEGRVAECDAPAALLADSTSLFYGLVKNWESTHDQGSMR